MERKLPETAKWCLCSLWDKGYEAHIVGGCVRDSLLGRTPADWDICTSALPDEIVACFPGNRVLPTGLAHGTVTVLEGGTPLEVTTFRADGDYLDHRHPAQVRFTRSLREDLARRDFTVNAMAWHPRKGLTDPFGGREDLKAGLLRCVGDASLRFGEDALRILRLFRFAAQLDFDMEERTLAAARDCRDDLLHISAERVSGELTRLLTCRAPGRVLEKMRDTGVLQVILPECIPCVGFNQRTPYHNRTVDAHTFAAVDAVSADAVLRWTMLLHDIAKPACFKLDRQGIGHCKGHDVLGAEMAAAILARLRLDNRTAGQIVRLIALHNRGVVPEEVPIRRLLSRLGEETVRRLIQVKTADTLAKEPAMTAGRLEALEKAGRMIDEIMAQSPCLTLDKLAVNGRDLLAAGLSGPQVGQTLRRLLDLVVEGRLPNQREALLEEMEK